MWSSGAGLFPAVSVGRLWAASLSEENGVVPEGTTLFSLRLSSRFPQRRERFRARLNLFTQKRPEGIRALSHKVFPRLASEENLQTELHHARRSGVQNQPKR